MKKKIILPFDENPMSIMYHGIAFPLGIIQGNALNDITPWVICKYVNCWFMETGANKFMNIVKDNWAIEDNILLQQRLELFPDLYSTLFHIDIIHLLKEMINQHFYPHGLYNEQFIPGKESFQKQRYIHDFIIIGYNDLKKKFYSVGYLKDRKFKYYDIPYKNFTKSIETLNTEKVSFNFWQYNPHANLEFNLQRLSTELYDYINSTTSAKISSLNKQFGIKSIEYLADYFSKICDGHSFLDDRYTRGLMEHKNFMAIRMKYLYDHKYLTNTLSCEKSTLVFNMSKKVHMLGIKYNLTHNVSVISQINETMYEMIDIEKQYIPTVLEDLQKF